MDARIRRRQVLILVGTSLATCGSAIAQKKIPRVGMLSLDSGETLEPVREGLRALGYVDGKNIRLEERAAEDHYDKLAAIAREFVSLNVDVIITSGSTATTAAQRTTSTIPIVMRFLHPEMPRRLMPRIKRLFARAGLEREEVNILRGILARIDQLIGRAK